MTNQIVLIVTCNFRYVILIFTLQPPGWVNDVREEILRRSVCFYPNVIAYVVLNCGPNSIKHFEHLRCAQAKILHIAVDTQSEVRNVDLFVPNKLWFVKAPNIYCQTSCRRALSTSRPWAQKRLGKCLGSTPHPIEKIVFVLFWHFGQITPHILSGVCMVSGIGGNSLLPSTSGWKGKNVHYMTLSRISL